MVGRSYVVLLIDCKCSVPEGTSDIRSWVGYIALGGLADFFCVRC
jgi:hypothetical protein